MNNNQLLTKFIERLMSMQISAALTEKYVNEYKRLLCLRGNAHKHVKEHLPNIRFGCFCKDTTRISTEKKLMKMLVTGAPVDFRVFSGIKADDNLLNLITSNDVTTPKLQPLAKIRVWQEADANNLPTLTMREIITQIPYCLIKKVKVVCLLSEEDNITVNAYNNLMGAYEYNIWLFS